jgi:hypothetical protein
MELKDFLFYGLIPPVILYAIYEGVLQIGYAQALSQTYPECYKPNPYLKELFFGTHVLLLILMIPTQHLAKSIFLRVLPVEKFPVGSKTRLIKAEIMSERMFRFILYSVFSLANFWILKQSNFLDKLLLGSEVEPAYF